MSISGLLVPLEALPNGNTKCHLGVYDTGELELEAKFWTSTLPLNKVIFFTGALQRNPVNQEVWIDIKFYNVVTDARDDMVLNSILSVHRVLVEGSMIKADTWHGRALGNCGNFLTKFCKTG